MVTSSRPGLPTGDALLDWAHRASEATKQRFADDAFAQDSAAIETLLNDPDQTPFVARRGAWLYNFRSTATNPRGLWQRVPDGTMLTPDTIWETVFDVDAFCNETGEIWHWRGAQTAWFDPNRVMLCLSLRGSDQTRYIEFDLVAKTIVPDGFDLPPSRSRICWRDPETLLVDDADTKGCATQSGWPRVSRALKRGVALSDAPILFEAEHGDLLAASHALPDAKGNVVEAFSRMTAIGKEICTLRDADGTETRIPAPEDTEIRGNTTHAAWVIQDRGGTPGALILWDRHSNQQRTIFTPSDHHSVDAGSIWLLKDLMLWKQNDAITPSLWALDLSSPGAVPTHIPMPEPAESFWFRSLDSNPDCGDGTLQVSLQGFLTPPTIYTLDLSDLSAPQWQLSWRSAAKFDAPDHEVTLCWATSQDGTRVPYHLVAPKSHNGDVPTLIYGYGGFGHALAPYYGKITGKMWLEKGYAYALAYIRGGAELGPDWHLQAKGAGRDRAFADFVAVSRDITAQGLASPARIACHGGSNGGLLCGVMLTRYPEDFGAVWASVGVYDMLTYHKFPAGAGWIDEYGDPDDPDAAKWLQSYSPLHQIDPARAYPPALIETSLSDDRVDPSHSRWFARALAEARQPVHYAEHSDGGHGGGGASHAQAAEMALAYAFLRRTICR